MTDAFAQAAMNSAAAFTQATTTATAVLDMPAGALADVDDPFATSSEVKTGGIYTPRVPFEDLEGRTVVMIPRSYDPAAKMPEQFKQQGVDTREEFRVDLVVLDGAPFTYEYTERDPSNPTGKLYRAMEVKELPFVALSQTIAQGGLVAKLKGVTGLPGRDAPKTSFTTAPRLFLGVMRYAPYRSAEKRGATIESVTAEVHGWIERGRKTTKPDYTWALDDRAHVLTPERRGVAIAWWNAYRKSLAS